MKGNGLSGTLMTLTPTGRLGIGLTTPTTPLHVLGGATVSGSLTVGNNLIISGTINANLSGNVSGNLTGNVNGNANAAAGISTFNNISASGIATITSVRSNNIGIGLQPSLPLTVNSNVNRRFFVNANGNVGIKTTDTQAMDFMVAGSSVHQILGVGTTIPVSSVDFSLAGQGITGPFANKMFMIPPKVSATGTLAGVVSGALVYNTNVDKLQVYNGSSWVSLATGGGEPNQNAFSNVQVTGQSTVAADTTNDTLKLVAGSNVTITTDASTDSVTIAASGGGGGSQNVFSTIAVSGQNNVVADSTTDTLTLVAGSNMTITTNDSSDTITFASSGGGSGISNVVEDTSPQLGGALDVQAQEINTSTTNGNIKLAPNGSGVVEVRGAGGNDGTLQLNCSAQSHGIKLKSPPHSASASYTLTFPNSIVNGQFLKTDASGNLSWDSRLGAGAVNVKDYGAVGDYNVQTSSGTDDRAAIIAAINALGTEGGTVYFPPGNYYVSSQIEINGNSGGDVVSNCLIFEGLSSPADGGYGDAGGAEICVPQNANYTIFYVNGAEAVYFRNLRFRGGNKFGSGGTGSNSTNHAIKLERRISGIGGNDHLLENLIFVGMTACIQLYGVGRTTIRKIKIGNCPSASTDIIRVDENQEGASADRRLDQLRIEGCVIDAAPDNTSDASRNNANGLGIYATSNTIFVKDTSIIRANYNFFLDSASDGEFIYFTNCEAERAQVDGFYINGSEFISIDNCFSCGNNQSGVRIDGNTVSSVSMTNCNIRTNQRHGIHLNAGNLQDLSIVNARMGANNVSNGTYHNVYLANGTHNVYIAGGKMGGSTTLNGTGNQKYGIYIDGTSHDHIRIIGANVNGNTDGGIYVDGSWGGTGNKIQFNTGTAITKNT
tara:strand:- start:248 stop:2914 length:2667 start_codon:yes stop_codon:yes gene_type:complete